MERKKPSLKDKITTTVALSTIFFALFILITTRYLIIEILEPVVVNRVLAIVALSAIFSVVVSVFIGLWLSGIIIKPILALQDACKKMVGGDLLARVITPIHKCWEIMGCNKKDCPSYGSEFVRCWFISGTMCMDGVIMGEYPEKLGDCHKCKVYQRYSGNEIDSLSDSFNHMASLLNRNINELQNVSMEMALGLSECFEALRKIGEGELGVKVKEVSENELLRKLELEVNKTTSNIEKLVNDAEELAIGLSECFEVLAMVSKGDFSVKMKEVSENELIAKLGRVVNQTTEVIKRNVDELKAAYSDIEKKVIEKTEEFQNAHNELVVKHSELVKREQELEVLNKELDSFVYTASHDLKEPLRGIETFSKFLLDDYWEKLDDEGKDYLRRISNGANRLKLFIDDLLSLSRISRIKNPYETFSSNDIIKDVLKRLELMIKDKDCKLKVDDNLPLVYGDKIKLKEIFYNLISNAIKHNDKKPNIEVFGEENERETIFSIKDNGIGIKEEDFIRVFEPFKRLHKRDEYGKGTGIGLAIVKKVIDEHKGRIWVESKINEGSTFYFSLPKKMVTIQSLQRKTEGG
ncbi:MAG: ATP-binding protein [bacterium]